jgi:hypothetical protein
MLATARRKSGQQVVFLIHNSVFVERRCHQAPDLEDAPEIDKG